MIKELLVNEHIRMELLNKTKIPRVNDFFIWNEAIAVFRSIKFTNAEYV